MSIFAAIFDLTLLAVGIFLLVSGIFEVATRRPPPGVLGRSLVNPAATAQFVESWTGEEWHQNGVRLTAIGATLLVVGAVLFWA